VGVEELRGLFCVAVEGGVEGEALELHVARCYH
jgi:hypothetical protein